MKVDRWLLVVAYALLVGVVVFLSYDVDRQLETNRTVLCDTAWANAGLAFSTFDVALADGEVTESDQELLVIVVGLIDLLTETCGQPPGLTIDPETGELAPTTNPLAEPTSAP